ncbi:CAP domain-containing protein [Sporolactobacillus sp. STSJ-5]|uniref:CAP domain-containing protein n=1 Tax=Sporolactobacillus sp. STSJ-5 TaxID=2965076 RepID=UPI002103596E|nr:CAP domain-containing protein [Sporolactobacillus sp. STSJ-5]MCQ2010871.1 CAP domain-containing protein [Sporolactobacillus sp. STSJ-5]
MRFFKHTLVGLLIIILSLTTASISNADQSKSTAGSTKQSQPVVQQNESITSGVEAKTVKKHAKKKAKKPAVKKSIKKSVKKKSIKKTVKKAKKSVKKKKTVKKAVKKAVKKTATVHKAAVKKAPVKTAAKAPVKAAAPKAQTTAPGQYNASVEQQIVSLVNNVRAQNGLQALQVKPELQSFARQWSQQQFSKSAMSHGMMNFSRNTIAGQNVAYAKGDVNYFGWDQIWSAQATMNDWMNSPDHRANILKPQYKYIGVGVVYGQKNGSSDGWAFFTQDFSD